MSLDALPEGSLDIHVHTAPDVVARPLDDLDLARSCRSAGMAGAVLKSHTEATASRAFIATCSVPGVTMFGGIVLNRSVGGLNPDAVDAMARNSGGRGRIVWLPTRDAEHERVHKSSPGPVVPVTDGGRPVAGLGEVFDVVAAHDLVLATGHVSPTEALVVFRAARKAGCRRLLVTHATAPISNYADPELSEMVRLGAWVEFSVRNLFAAAPDGQKIIDPEKAAIMLTAIRRVGSNLGILSSDLGDGRYPLPVAGLLSGTRALVRSGLTLEVAESLLRVRPIEVLGLPS